MTDPIKGDGWAVGRIDDLGERAGLPQGAARARCHGVRCERHRDAAGYASGPHYHERQEELYLVLAGRSSSRWRRRHEEYHGSGRRPGARRRRHDPPLRNTSDTDEAVYLCVGGEDGYVGRDGRTVGDEAL